MFILTTRFQIQHMTNHRRHWNSEKSTQCNIFSCIYHSYLFLYTKVEQIKQLLQLFITLLGVRLPPSSISPVQKLKQLKQVGNEFSYCLHLFSYYMVLFCFQVSNVFSWRKIHFPHCIPACLSNKKYWF